MGNRTGKFVMIQSGHFTSTVMNDLHFSLMSLCYFHRLWSPGRRRVYWVKQVWVITILLYWGWWRGETTTHKPEISYQQCTQLSRENIPERNWQMHSTQPKYATIRNSSSWIKFSHIYKCAELLENRNKYLLEVSLYIIQGRACVSILNSSSGITHVK